MSNLKNRPNILEYLDAAQYLQDYFDWRKSMEKGFNYTVWAEQLCLGSKTILRFILKKRRNISRNMISVFKANLNLVDHEAEYFDNLVGYSQAKSTTERKTYGQALLRAQKSHYSQITMESSKVASNVYGPVLLTLLTFSDLKKTADHVAGLLGVPTETAREIMNLFVQQGVLVKHGDEEYSFSANAFKIPNNLGSLELKKFYEFWLGKSIQALETNPERRRFRSLKFALNQEEYEEILQVLNDHATAILSRNHREQLSGRSLYMLNTVLFPVTQVETQESHHIEPAIQEELL